jgi:hypothetical protein
VQPQLRPSAGRPSTLGSLRIKMRLGPGSVAHAVRSTCGLQHGGASHPLQKGFGPLNQTEDRDDDDDGVVAEAEPRPQPPSDAA